MSELKIVQTSEQKGKGQMIFEIMNAKRNVTAYLAKHLSDYKLVKIIRKSIYPEDAHLYMVSAKRKDGKFLETYGVGYETLKESVKHVVNTRQELEEFKKQEEKHNGKTD